MARPDREELRECSDHWVICINRSFRKGPVKALNGPIDGFSSNGRVTGSTAGLRGHRRSLGFFRLDRVDREVKTDGVAMTNEGSKKPIKVREGDSHRENLADGIGEGTNDPLATIGLGTLADDGPGEKPKGVVPTAGKLGAVSRIGPDLGTTSVANTRGQGSLEEGYLGRVGDGGERDMLDISSFTTTESEGRNRHDESKEMGTRLIKVNRELVRREKEELKRKTSSSKRKNQSVGGGGKDNRRWPQKHPKREDYPRWTT